jgi:hypothetical protein
MRTSLRDVAALAFAGAIALSVAGWAGDAPAQQPGGGPGSPGAMIGAPPDTNDPDVKALAAVRQHILGKEHMPADSVFDNIKVFKGMEAGRVPNIMGAFTHALGAHCTLCHVSGKFASEDKKEKQIARDMMHMTSVLNDSLLHKIANVDDDAHISCYTCHHGQPKPASRAPGMGGPPPGGAPGGPPPGGPGGGGDHH